ncbi:MAG: Gfo/Idh/MocA family oxidoreductase, partial [Candidatus Margulisiibacteriota bacterium]
MKKNKVLKIGVFGFGYWGPNLVRNFHYNEKCCVKTIVDLNEARLAVAQKLYPHVQISKSPDDLYKDPEIDAVVVALPVGYHFEFAQKALLNDKHVLIEKPMTNSKAQALELIELAQKKRKILMVDHTFLYTGAVAKIKEIITSGEIGEVQYFDSIRINLGLFQHDVSVIWDLAPHDLSIIEYLIEERASSVAVTGISHTSNNIENIAYMTLYFKSNKIAHFNLSWTS